jgi:hypothetical protein
MLINPITHLRNRLKYETKNGYKEQSMGYFLLEKIAHTLTKIY